MITKAFEIRDAATFIPVIATKMIPQWIGIDGKYDEANPERYLLRRAGFGFDDPCVIVCRMEASGADRNATYDPYSWTGARTMQVAHLYITEHFDALESGAVVDVEFILGESQQSKQSERLETV